MIFLGLTFACSKKDLAVNQDLTAINTPDLLGKWICKN
jgi:hypothetical protein